MKMNLLHKIVWDDKFNYRFTRHFMFWLVILIYFTSFSIYNGEILFYLKTNLILLPFDIVVTYLIIYFIYSKFLLKKQYLKFIVYLLIVLIIYWLSIKFCYKHILPYFLGNSRYLELRSNLSLVKQAVLESETPLIIILSAIAIKSAKNWHKVEVINQKLEKVGIENKMTMLTAQLHPHFLFNTLNNLYALALNSSKKTPEVIMKLSLVMRYIIDDYNKVSVELRKEFEVIKSYIEIEKLRYDNNLEIKFDVNIPDDYYSNIVIPPLLIFTFVENAFKHGARKCLDNPWINVKIFMEDKLLKVLIENSVVDDDKLENREGIGLKNVKKRLELYYPNRYKYSAKKLYNRFKVFLEIKI